MADASEFTRKTARIASIRASVLLSLVHYFDGKSGKTDIFLAEHGLLRAQLTDPYALIPLARYLAIFEAAAEVLRDPGLGAHLGSSFMPGDIGPIGILFSSCGTIRRGFHLLSKHMNAVQGSTGAGLFEECGERLVWSYQLTDPALWPRRQDCEFTLAASCQLVRLAFSRTWRPMEVHFEHGAPKDIDPLRQVFRAPILFGQSSNRLVITRSDADRLYRMEDKSLIAVLERHISDLVGQEPPDDRLSDKVLSLMGLHIGHMPMTVRSVATELGLSTRTLQRRLNDEGTSLRDLLRGYRRDMADRQLGEGAISHERIAETIGYAGATVFWRAYRTWTGHAPSRRHRSDTSRLNRAGISAPALHQKSKP